MYAEMDKGGRYASVATTDVAKQVTSRETMSAPILAAFDREAFTAQFERLDLTTQQAFLNVLKRLAAMTDEEVAALKSKLASMKRQQPDELRLVSLLVNLPDDESFHRKMAGVS